MITPITFLALLSCGTVALLIAQRVMDRRYRRKLIALARDWRMHYAADDRFDLAPRVAERLALPGAADVRVIDLIYGSESGTRRYIFSAHYTRGVVRWKRRVTCVASLSESTSGGGSEWSKLNVAPVDMTLIQQYQTLEKAMS